MEPAQKLAKRDREAATGSDAPLRKSLKRHSFDAGAPASASLADLAAGALAMEAHGGRPPAALLQLQRDAEAADEERLLAQQKQYEAMMRKRHSDASSAAPPPPALPGFDAAAGLTGLRGLAESAGSVQFRPLPGDEEEEGARGRKGEAGSYPCGVDACGKSFASRQGLQNHVMTVHEKKRSFECRQCAKKFSANGSLKRHVDTVHKGKRDFNCGRCGKAFALKHHLKNHMITVHNEKNVDLSNVKPNRRTSVLSMPSLNDRRGSSYSVNSFGAGFSGGGFNMFGMPPHMGINFAGYALPFDGSTAYPPMPQAPQEGAPDFEAQQQQHMQQMQHMQQQHMQQQHMQSMQQQQQQQQHGDGQSQYAQYDDAQGYFQAAHESKGSPSGEGAPVVPYNNVHASADGKHAAGFSPPAAVHNEN